ncbi:PREDICTED: disease resistance protein RGA2-like [Nelumbo nucifera]|uniref:Disease resistance protein RGA3 n=2 Tax=Nelumbo nucifera TaxID=4432 RepID=A0A822YK32_NELNU|nr:PREDICTED: disease resistance protein RGA2-like [Nelumbo nucifera]DAD32473.1 TPA_asm: hypothetical protein HUJ06_011324 [Nelumbo nucifera]
MAEFLVSTALDQLASMGLEQLREECRLISSVGDEVNRLSNTFRTIQAVIEDAEEKQVSNQAVKEWLVNIKDAAYDIHDLLDEWNTKHQISRMNKRSDNASCISLMKKVSNTYLFPPFFCFNPIHLRHNMGIKMKKIRKRLATIATDRVNYQLTETATSNRRRIDEIVGRARSTSSQVDVSEIVGRDVEKEEIISKLVSDQSSRQHEIGLHPVPIISIYGMGGSGKTTLAKLIYNDHKITTHFQVRIWVCVSEPFDKAKIAKAIVEAVEGNINFRGDIEWQVLHQKLTNSLQGKLYLLILDDVWSDKESEWEDLKISLNQGSLGNRIVVTTRKQNVAEMRGTTYSHRLGMLSDENCWMLLSRIAFDGRTEEECAKLEEVGKKIAKKCQGLPLSAKTLGGLLRNKKPFEHEWKHVLESNTWELLEAKQDDFNGAVLLSYYDLPPHLKRCFAFCAVFPKDYVMEKDTLIKLWMAQGFLKSTNTSHHHMGRTPELLGEDYFDELANRAFFHDFVRDENGNIEQCKMHDIVHDFAQFLTKDECYAIEMEINDNINAQDLFNFHKARHLSLELASYPESTKPAHPLVICKAEKLRTLLLSSFRVEVSLPDLFHHLTCLRALRLEIGDIKEIPREVGMLMHLRFLDLSNQLELKELPETICDLYNLQSLNLDHCQQLKKLPKGIGKLTQMRYLGIEDTTNLKHLPQGIGRLCSLHTLSKFVVSDDDSDGGCKIEELNDLNNLKGNLEIKELGKVANKNEASMADLKKKQHLCHLWLSFSEGSYKDDDTVERMEGVLEALEPPQFLETLGIYGYIGSKLPNWMNHLLLPNLVCLQLFNFKNCKQLPPSLGKLPSLKEIALRKWNEVKCMNLEFFGLINTNNTGRTATYASEGNDEEKNKMLLFPKLDYISISDMPNLEEWSLRIQEEGGETTTTTTTAITFMPCLRTLKFRYCSSLKALVHMSAAAPLRTLVIENRPQLASSSSSCLPEDLEELEIEEKTGDIHILESLQPNNSIKLLTLSGSGGSRAGSLPRGLKNLAVLRTLKVRSWKFIASLPEPEELQHLTMIQELSIWHCPALKKSCQKEIGEEWNKISHIPNIIMDDTKIQ